MHAVALPAGACPGVLAEAVRFALFGRLPADRAVITEGAGYAWVEAGVATDDGAAASVFRGVDRRGVLQVSLREDAGTRIASGEGDVAARLEELLGARSADLERAMFVSTDADPLAAWTEPSSPAHEPAGGAAATAARDTLAVEAARHEAGDAADALRRTLHLRGLDDRSARDHAELLALGSKLRGERSDTARAVEKIVGDRDRIRVRLRRVNEYRDLCARAQAESLAHPAAAPPRLSPRVVEFALGLCAAGILAILVIPDTGGAARGDVAGRAVAGLGFVLFSASYLWVASRRRESERAVARGTPAAPAEQDAGAPAELRARYADLGDPDDPNLVDDLRARLSRSDELAAPLQSKLERLDDAISLLDVEAGRAARALHLPPPPKDEAAVGFGAGDVLGDIVRRIAALGDQVHQASVERDALRAHGAPPATAADAARAVQDAFRRLGALCGDADAAVAAAVREGATPEAVEALPLQADAAAFAARLDAAADEIVAGSHPASRTPAAAPGPIDATLGVQLGRVVAGATRGRWTRARSGSDGRLVLLSPGEPAGVPWADLDAALRARVALAVRLCLGESAIREHGGGALRMIVLDARPAGFSTDEELAAFAVECAPSVAQVLYGAPGDAVPATGAPPELQSRGDGRRV